MKIYIYPNGEVHQTIQSDMSDDWFIIESTTPLYEAAGLITAHFGVKPQAYQVWQEVMYFFGEQPFRKGDSPEPARQYDVMAGKWDMDSWSWKYINSHATLDAAIEDYNANTKGYPFRHIEYSSLATGITFVIQPK